MVSHLLNTIRNVVGITGNVISLFLFLAPVPTFIRIWKKGSVEQFSPAPYLATLINCMVWVIYGLPMVHPNSTLVVTINGTGTAIEVVYITLFLIFCHDKSKRRKVLLIMLVELFFIAVVTTLVLTVVHTTERRSMVVGVIAILFNIMMYASPLSVMSRAFQRRFRRKLLQLRTFASRFLEMRNGVETWKYDGNKYCIAKVWEEIRPRQNKVAWNRLLWSNLVIPRHAAISWMALLNRLPTLDKLVAWGLTDVAICRLCQEEGETRNHLFFGCCYSKAVWKNILQLCGLQREVHGWDMEVNWAVKKLKGKSLVATILRIAWRAYIYCIWRERNQRMYNQKSESGSNILKQIKSIVQLKTCRLQYIEDDSLGKSF